MNDIKLAQKLADIADELENDEFFDEAAELDELIQLLAMKQMNKTAQLLPPNYRDMAMGAGGMGGAMLGQQLGKGGGLKGRLLGGILGGGLGLWGGHKATQTSLAGIDDPKTLQEIADIDSQISQIERQRMELMQKKTLIMQQARLGGSASPETKPKFDSNMYQRSVEPIEY